MAAAQIAASFLLLSQGAEGPPAFYRAPHVVPPFRDAHRSIGTVHGRGPRASHESTRGRRAEVEARGDVTGMHRSEAGVAAAAASGGSSGGGEASGSTAPVRQKGRISKRHTSELLQRNKHRNKQMRRHSW